MVRASSAGEWLLLVVLISSTGCELDHLHGAYGAGGSQAGDAGPVGGGGGGGSCQLAALPTLEWALSFGDSANQAIQGVVALPDGVLLSGSYYGALDFGGPQLPAASPTNDTVANGFTAELDALNGSYREQHGIASDAVITSAHVTRHADGRLWLTSHEHEAAGPGRLHLTAFGASPADGPLWARTFDHQGGAGCSDGRSDGFAKVVTNEAGDLIVAGRHFDCLDFDREPIGQEHNGDVFIARFDGATDGPTEPLATASVSIQGHDEPSTSREDHFLDVATLGRDVIVAGKFTTETLSIRVPAGSGEGPTCLDVADSGGDWTLFVARFDEQLRCRWVVPMAVGTTPGASTAATIGRERVSQLAVPGDRILLATDFDRAVTIGGIPLEPSDDDPDIALIELDGDGQVVTAVPLGGPGPERPHALGLAGDRLIMSGEYDTQIDLGGACGELIGTPGGFGYFLAAFDVATLDCVWAKAAPTPNAEVPSGWTTLGTDGCHNVYWGGSFAGDLRFESSGSSLNSVADLDVFVARFTH